MRCSDFSQPSMRPSSIFCHFQSPHWQRTRDHSVCERRQSFGSIRLLCRRILELSHALFEDCSNFQPHTRSQEQRGIFKEQSCSSKPGCSTLCCAIDKWNRIQAPQVGRAPACSSFHMLSTPRKTWLVQKDILQSFLGPILSPFAFSSASHTTAQPLCSDTYSATCKRPLSS